MNIKGGRSMGRKKKDKLIQIASYFPKDLLDWIDSEVERLGLPSRNSYMIMEWTQKKNEDEAQKKKDEGT